MDFHYRGRFLDHIVYFRVLCIVVGLYLLVMCAGACGLTLFRCLLRSINRLGNAWSFQVLNDAPSVPAVPIVKEPVSSGADCQQAKSAAPRFPSFKPTDSDGADSLLSSPIPRAEWMWMKYFRLTAHRRLLDVTKRAPHQWILFFLPHRLHRGFVRPIWFLCTRNLTCSMDARVMANEFAKYDC